MPEILKIAGFTFERYEHKGGRKSRYDGFCLSTAGIYMTRITSQKWVGTSEVRIYHDAEIGCIKLTPNIPDLTFKLHFWNNQCYIPTTQLQKIMPRGRYIYQQDHDGGRCYQLESKVENLTNQNQNNVPSPDPV